MVAARSAHRLALAPAGTCADLASSRQPGHVPALSSRRHLGAGHSDILDVRSLGIRELSDSTGRDQVTRERAVTERRDWLGQAAGGARA
jgi:hypothetical protein